MSRENFVHEKEKVIDDIYQAIDLSDTNIKLNALLRFAIFATRCLYIVATKSLE